MGHVRRAEVQRSKWKKRTGKERTHLEVIKEGGERERGREGGVETVWLTELHRSVNRTEPNNGTNEDNICEEHQLADTVDQ